MKELFGLVQEQLEQIRIFEILKYKNIIKTNLNLTVFIQEINYLK